MAKRSAVSAILSRCEYSASISISWRRSWRRGSKEAGKDFVHRGIQRMVEYQRALRVDEINLDLPTWVRVVVLWVWNPSHDYIGEVLWPWSYWELSKPLGLSWCLDRLVIAACCDGNKLERQRILNPALSSEGSEFVCNPQKGEAATKCGDWHSTWRL